MRVKPGHQQSRAAAEVILVAGAYIVISTSAVGTFDVSSVFPAGWSADERSTGSGFLVGAVVQVALVLVGAYLLGLQDLRRAIAASVAPSTRQAWIIAGIATAIHIGTAMLLFLPQTQRVWEPSGLNLMLSLVPAADGWSQEVLFRGYVIFRLARAGIPPPSPRSSFQEASSRRSTSAMRVKPRGRSWPLSWARSCSVASTPGPCRSAARA